MTEPLSDETLRNYDADANYLDMGRHPGDRAMAGTIRALLAEVARLKAELASQAGYEQTLSDVDVIAHDHFVAVENPMPQGTCFGEAALCLKEELARLRAENADLAMAVDRTKAINAEFARLNGELEIENATLREDNARLTAALEAQGEAAFVAGMRAMADIEELAREIAEFACEYLTGEKPDTEAMEEVIGAILRGALEGEQQ